MALVVVALAVLGVVALARALLVVDAHGARVRALTIHSRFAHHDQRMLLVTPAGGGDGRPLLVFLHGRGSDGEDSNNVSAFYAALRRMGSRAPDVVMPNGADHSYWHDRADGRWDAYMMNEVIPIAISHLHANPHRIAIAGISMGGFGALAIGRRHPGRFCAVAGHSPALWQTGGETAAGAFDDADDFARNDLVALAARHPSPWGQGTKLWLDAGTGDPFDPGDKAFVAALRAAGTPIAVHRWPGVHNAQYWHRHYIDYLRFYARAFDHCAK